MRGSRSLRAIYRGGAPRGVAVSIAGVAALGLVACTEPGAERTCMTQAALIPAYLPPAELTELLTSPDPTRLVVVNPDNGPGGALDPAYADAIAELRLAGSTRVLGYVPTGYATRDPKLVETDVARYASWYSITDIFVDEVAAGQDGFAYYTSLSARLRARADRLVVFNPGVVPARGYFDLADIVVTFEGSYADFLTRTDQESDEVDGLFTARTAHLIYDASDDEALDAVATSPADYVYASPATLPNPWATLPLSLARQTTRLGRC